MSNNYDGPTMMLHIYRLREQIARDTVEIDRLKAERDALLEALQYAIKQVPEFATVPGIAAAIDQASKEQIK